MYARTNDNKPRPALFGWISLLLAGLLLGGCDETDIVSDPPRVLSDITLVNSGTLLLECNEYCASEVSIGPDDAIAVFSGRDSLLYPPQLRRTSISAPEWNDLVNAVDLDTFMALDTNPGREQATPKGFEWIELEAKGARRRVTFELGDSIPAIMPLLQKVRAVRGRIRL